MSNTPTSTRSRDDDTETIDPSFGDGDVFARDEEYGSIDRA